MCGGHVGCCLGGLSCVRDRRGSEACSKAYQVVQLGGVDTLVDTRDDLHCDGSGVDMVWVEAVT